LRYTEDSRTGNIAEYALEDIEESTAWRKKLSGMVVKINVP
jgi:hypothetical protein